MPIPVLCPRNSGEYAKTQGNLLPSAENVCYFLDAVGRETIQRSLAAARDKASSPRERRQIERLSAAVRYWEMAAEIFNLRAEAKRRGKTDPQAAWALLEKAVDKLGPEPRQYVATSMPPGWCGVRVPVMWDRTLDRMRQTADKLHN